LDVYAINKMSHQLDVQRLEFAFQGRPDIIGAIQKAAGLTIPKPHLRINRAKHFN
jgi:hypothetical protein